MDFSTTQPSWRGPREPMLGLFACVAAGVMADRAFDLPCGLWLLMVCLALAGWLGGHLWCRLGHLGPVAAARKLAILASVCSLAAAWHHVYWNFYDRAELAFTVTEPAQPVCVRAVVLSPPANVVKDLDPLVIPISQEQCLLDVRVMALRGAHNGWREAVGCCRVRVRGQLRTVQPGDTVILWGRPARARVAMNPGGWEADHFARTKRMLCMLDVKHPGCVQRVACASRWNPAWFLPRLCGCCEHILLTRIGGRPGELAVAALLGVRSHVDDQTIDSFLVTGTIHLLAISGLNVGIVAYVLLNLLNALRVPRHASLIAVMLFCLAYTMLVGCQAPVVRATVMVWVSCAGMLLYRPCLSFNTLAAAGTIVLGLNPTELFAAGAQLSFVAVAGMIWIVPKLADPIAGNASRMFYRRHHSVPRWLAAKLARNFLTVGLASIAIWLLTLPLVSFHFNLISPIALCLNLFLWIPLATGLISGLVTIALAWSPAIVIAAPAAVCRISFQLLGDCVRGTSGVEYGHFWVPGPPKWLVVVFYTGLFLGLGIPLVRLRWKTLTGVLFGCLMTGWLGCAWVGTAPPKELQVTFLSVGHGTCVMMQLPDGRVWLYDAGTCGNHRFAVREISKFLWSRGITRIDGLVLSHADLDHYNAMPGLIRRFPIASIFTPCASLASPQPGMRTLRDSADHASVPIALVNTGDRIRLNSPVTILVRHPAAHETLRDNEASLVLEIEYQGRRILLPGDLEGEGMDRLLGEPPTDYDLVMAPHHGSRHSAPEAFCHWATPEWIIISGGRQALGAPHTPFRDSGAKVLVTARHGAIQARIVDGQLRVSAFARES